MEKHTYNHVVKLAINSEEQAIQSNQDVHVCGIFGGVDMIVLILLSSFLNESLFCTIRTREHMTAFFSSFSFFHIERRASM